jgi:hypothetical protein
MNISFVPFVVGDFKLCHYPVRTQGTGTNLTGTRDFTLSEPFLNETKDLARRSTHSVEPLREIPRPAGKSAALQDH